MNYDTARKNLIEQQIKSWNVHKKNVIHSLYSVKRENFVPLEYKNFALSDFQIPINNSEFMMSPLVEARLLQECLSDNNGEILEIGTGLGYMASLLSQIYNSVVSYEINALLAKKAHKNIMENNIPNVTVVHGDGLKANLKDYNRKFDAILLSGAVNQDPTYLSKFVNSNGKIIAIIGKKTLMEAVSFKKKCEYGLSKNILFETKINFLHQHLNTNFFTF